MNKVIVLTKPNCPQCNNLKMYLQYALNNKYNDDMIFINQENDQKEFKVYQEKFNVISLPAMIFEDDIIRETNPSNVSNFLEKHIGKK